MILILLHISVWYSKYFQYWKMLSHQRGRPSLVNEARTLGCPERKRGATSFFQSGLCYFTRLVVVESPWVGVGTERAGCSFCHTWLTLCLKLKVTSFMKSLWFHPADSLFFLCVSVAGGTSSFRVFITFYWYCLFVFCASLQPVLSGAIHSCWLLNPQCLTQQVLKKIQFLCLKIIDVTTRATT